MFSIRQAGVRDYKAIGPEVLMDCHWDLQFLQTQQPKRKGAENRWETPSFRSLELRSWTDIVLVFTSFTMVCNVSDTFFDLSTQDRGILFVPSCSINEVLRGCV